MTLLELLIAGMIGLVIILALGQTDVARLLIGSRMRDTVFRHADARSAVGHVVKRLEAADRIVLVAASDVLVRIPPTTNPPPLDNAASYRWVQYKLVGNELRYHDNPSSSCAISVRFNDVAGFTLNYEDRSPAPPGGEPLGGSDSNLVQVTLTSTDPQTGTTTTFPASVTIRGAGYTNVTTGLSEVGPSPPTPCS